MAGAPVTAWENSDTFYTERYLGLPQSNPPAYRSSSVLTYASHLSRPLPAIHGLTDDNVYAQHTLQLADSLFMAGKPFEFMPLLGTHLAGSSDPTSNSASTRLVQFFNCILKSSLYPDYESLPAPSASFRKPARNFGFLLGLPSCF